MELRGRIGRNTEEMGPYKHSTNLRDCRKNNTNVPTNDHLHAGSTYAFE